LNDPFELPSLEDIEQMDSQRSQAIESLKISDDYVKCQKCGMAVTLLRTLIKPRSNRIDSLEKQIKWIENYSRGNNGNKNNGLQRLQAELAELLEEEAKADKLRSLPLYSCRITGWKFVCSSVMRRSTGYYKGIDR
jgi:DNA-directed RNA polymerase subunit RPC12/RpoP